MKNNKKIVLPNNATSSGYSFNWQILSNHYCLYLRMFQRGEIANDESTLLFMNC